MSLKIKIIIGISVIFIIFSSWSIWKLQTTNVLVFTDRAEYEKGKNLIVAIQNNFQENICFSSCYPYFLEKKKSYWEWDGYRYRVCDKEDINTACIESGQVKAFEIELSWARTGLNRLVMPVCLDCKVEEQFKESKRFYSNEFIIKERVLTSY